MIGGVVVVAAFLAACIAASSLIHYVYRPWLDRRYAAERAEQRAITEWVAALRGTADAANRAADGMHVLGDAFAAMAEIARRPRPGPRS